ncbi:MAG: polymer-forming cytoskeletal protein [Pyrinomonadaceae bacterium]|nr:polymer-forming cytoskeletal protein [Pyrinomonadaceae bacterium]
MLRMGRNSKPEQTTTDSENTADHTPQSASTSATASSSPSSSSSSYSPSSSYGSGSGAYQSGSATIAPPPANASPLAPGSASRASTESETLAREIKEGTLSGFVGSGTVLTGEANFKGMLRVDGHLSGRVSSKDGTLIVSTGGQVDADIDVSIATINGTVNGDITASKRIELGRVAKVTGNIQAPALVIESGAIFEGSCRMAQVKEEQERPRAEEQSSSPYASLSSAASGSTDSDDEVSEAAAS